MFNFATDWGIGKTTRFIRVSRPVGTTIFSVHDKYGCLQDNFKVVVSK